MGFQSSITGAASNILGAAVAGSYIKDKRQAEQERKTFQKYESKARGAYGEFMQGLNDTDRAKLMDRQTEAMEIVKKRQEAMQFQALSVNERLKQLRGEEARSFDEAGHVQAAMNIQGLKSDLENLIRGGK